MAAAATDAAAGQGQLVIVEGPAGIGKSTILHAAAELAREAGLEVLGADGSTLERDVPYGIARQLLLAPVLAGSIDERDELLAGAAGLAAGPLGLDLPGQPPASGWTAEVHGLYWLSVGLAARRPLAFMIDDAQWADEASLRWLGHLSRRLSDLDVMVLIAHRPTRGPGDQDALDALLGSTRADMILTPRPLGRAAVADIVRLRLPDVDDSIVDWCFDITGGNPLLVNEVATAVIDRGLSPGIEVASVHGEAVTETVRRNVAHRLAEAGPEAETVARALLVLGRDADARRLAVVSRLDQPTTAAALDRLAVADIVTPGPRVEFRHALVLAALEATVSPAELAADHLAAAKLLANDGLGPERLAPHLLRAHTQRDPWVVDTLVAAAVAARRRGATGTARRSLERALAEPPEPGRRADVLLELARVEAMLGEDAAAGRFEEAVTLLEGPVAQGGALLRWGLATLATGDIPAGLDLLGHAQAVVGHADDDLATEIHAATIAGARMDVTTMPLARELLDRLSGERPRGDSASERALLAELAYLRSLTGHDREQAVDLALAALGGRALTELTTTPAISVRSALVVLIWTEELDVAQRATELLLQRARRRGQPVVFASAAELSAAIRFERGDVTGAIADARSALDAQPWGVTVPSVHGRLALGLLEWGDLDAATDALALPDGPDGLASTTPYYHYLFACGRVALARGDATEALMHARECGRLLEHAGNQNSATPPWRQLASDALLVIGNRTEAAAIARDHVDRLRRWGAAGHLGAGLACLAATETGAKRLALFGEAVEVLETSPTRLELAKARASLGAALLQDGEVEAASVQLHEALATARALEANVVEEGVAAILAATDGTPSPPAARASSPYHGLDADVRQAAELRDRGLTPTEVAQALFTTVGDVERRLDRLGRITDGLRPTVDTGTRVRLLGDFVIERDGERGNPPVGHPATALKLVALRRSLPADALAEELWPDVDPDRGRVRIRNVLSRARRTCGDLLIRDGEVIALADDVVVDVDAFEEATREALRARAEGRDALADARRALALYQGELLPADLYAAWAAGPRERLRRRRVEVLDLLAEVSERDGALSQASHYLHQAIDAEPFDEDRYIRGAALLARQGRLGAARQLLDRAEGAARELGVEPSSDVAALRDDLRI